VQRIAILLLALSAFGCTPDADSPRGVAEGFLDAHYVTLDLTAAVAYTTGLARHKVEDELRLVGDQEIDAGTLRPSVTYGMREERPEGEDRVTFLYDGKVKLEGGGSFEMSWLVNIRRQDGAWKVSNYKELPKAE